MSNLDEEIKQVSMMKQFEEDQKRNMTKNSHQPNNKPSEFKKTQKTEPLREQPREVKKSTKNVEQKIVQPSSKMQEQPEIQSKFKYSEGP